MVKKFKVWLRDYLIENLANQDEPVRWDSDLICTEIYLGDCYYHQELRNQDCDVLWSKK